VGFHFVRKKTIIFEAIKLSASLYLVKFKNLKILLTL